jgi:hypothetical protein
VLYSTLKDFTRGDKTIPVCFKDGIRALEIEQRRDKSCSKLFNRKSGSFVLQVEQLSLRLEWSIEQNLKRFEKLSSSFLHTSIPHHQASGSASYAYKSLRLILFFLDSSV